MLYHHLARFDSHRCCSSRDIMFLVCHMIKQDHITKESGDYNDRRPSRQVTILPGLVAIGIVTLEI